MINRKIVVFLPIALIFLGASCIPNAEAAPNLELEPECRVSVDSPCRQAFHKV